MNRRDVLRLAASLAAISLAPLGARAEASAYQPEALAADLAAGKTVVLHFYADWCPTCHAQARSMDKIRASNPAYDQSLTFTRVDWDTWKGSALTQTLNVPQRSIILVLNASGELGRVVNVTDVAGIQALLDQALASART